MNKVYKGDVGTEIVLECDDDISSAVALEIHVQKPDGSMTSWPATLKGTTQLSRYTAVGDLDQSGVYRLQAGVTLPSWSGRGEVVALVVYDHYQ